jgi:hypothetical protein
VGWVVTQSAAPNVWWLDAVQAERGDFMTSWGPRADEILPGSVGATQILPGSITTNEIAANTITANDIASGTITSNEIAANTITAAKLSTTAIDTMTITLAAGGRVQTKSSTPGNVIMDAGGFRAYNAAGTATNFNIDSSGNVSAIGLYAQGITLDAGPGGTANAANRINFTAGVGGGSVGRIDSYYGIGAGSVASMLIIANRDGVSQVGQAQLAAYGNAGGRSYMQILRDDSANTGSVFVYESTGGNFKLIDQAANSDYLQSWSAYPKTKLYGHFSATVSNLAAQTSTNADFSAPGNIPSASIAGSFIPFGAFTDDGGTTTFGRNVGWGFVKANANTLRLWFRNLAPATGNAVSFTFYFYIMSST